MLNKISCIEKITKETDNESNPEHEKMPVSSKGKASEESTETNISDLKTLSTSELSVPLFFPSKDKSTSQQTIIQESSPKSPLISLTQKHIISSFCDQASTKILQNMLMNEATKEDIDSIVNELRGTYRTIMKNKNGNYFCSDLFEVCSQQHRITILKEISKYISEDCVDSIGTHPLQNLIKYSSSEEEYKLILKSFDYNSLFFASLDPSGSYVVQKIIEHIPERYRTKFNLLFIKLICFISGKKFGVCNVKKFCSCTKNEDTKDQIVNLIKSNFLSIATNQFGNFLIQHILELWNNTSAGVKIKEEIISNFKVMYFNKYSTHICQLFLKLATMEEKKFLINALKLNLNNTNENMMIIKAILQSTMGYRNNIPNNNYLNPNQLPIPMNNFINISNQNNIINQNQFPITLNNYNNNINFMNQNQIHLSLKNNYK